MACVIGSYIRRVDGGVAPVCEMVPFPDGDDLDAMADWMEAAALAAERNEVLEFPAINIVGGLDSSLQSVVGGVEEVCGDVGGFPQVQPARVVGASVTGYCYADTFVESVRPAVVEALGAWPSVADVVKASVRFEMLSDEELERLFIRIADGRVHVGVESGVLTALNLVETVRACWRSGTIALYEKMLVGGGSPEADRRYARFDKLREAVVVGTVYEEEAARCHAGSENCWVSTLSRLVGIDVCVGRTSLVDVVTGPAFYTAAVAAGDPLVVVWSDHGTRAMHIAPAGRHIDGGGSGVAVVRLSGLTRLVSEQERCCWVQAGLVRDFPEVPEGRHLCRRCGCVVVLEGHDTRCHDVRVPMSGRIREDAWLGDAVHMFDVRRAVLEAGVPGRVATQRCQTYTQGTAQAEWYRLHVNNTGASGRLYSDTEASDLFEAEYGNFRPAYLRWLRSELPQAPEGVGTGSGVVELERGFSRLGVRDRARGSVSDSGGGDRSVGDKRQWVVVPERLGNGVVCVCPVSGCSEARGGMGWFSFADFVRHMELHDAYWDSGDPGGPVSTGLVVGRPAVFTAASRQAG